MPDIIGEIIEASTTEFTAESRKLHSPPPFGSFVKVITKEEELKETPNNSAIYAIVHHATTGTADTGRRPRAYWKDEKQLSEEQPEISEWMLVTEFKAVIIGYSSDGSIKQFLPPQPPRIHTFVYPCAPDEITAITSRMHFLRTLAAFPGCPGDEAVAACIRAAYESRSGEFEFLVDAGKELANLLKDDYDRLQAIMRRIQP